MGKAEKTMTRKPAKGAKKKKDPNAPKRGLSAYMFFANEQRENVRAENPGIAFGQVGKVLGERWKALSQKQRDPYEAKAAADKKRYEDEKAAYQANAGNGEDEEEDDWITSTKQKPGAYDVFASSVFFSFSSGHVSKSIIYLSHSSAESNRLS